MPIGGPAGGSIVLGAERWTECLNPIKTCASDWAWYTVLEHVLPRAMQLDARGNYLASPLLVEAPSLENGGLRIGPPFTVTFHIRDEAVWNDATPITSQDFEFTWKAILHTTNSAYVRQYRAIRSIDTTDPKTAILELRDVTARWPELFGGSRGFILKRAAFSRANAARPNLRLAMWHGIRFSGGPWTLKIWSHDQAVLARNDRYFSRQTWLSQITFVPRTDRAQAVSSFAAGEVAAMYADPSSGSTVDLTLLQQIGSDPRVKAVGATSTRFEALWFNPTLPPLNDRSVREALMYAVDRRAIVDRIVRLNDPTAEVLNCGFVALPDWGPWCSTKPFERFSYDPGKARQILESARYDCSSSMCTKNREPLEVRYITNDSSPLQTSIDQLVQEQARKAGIEVKLVHIEGGVLFGDACPFGSVAITQCAMTVPPDGSVADFLSCGAIPIGRNRLSGQNHTRWCNREADRLMRQSDRELDPSRRLQSLGRVHEIEAEVFMGLPMFVMPVVSGWRTDKIAGPIGKYSSTPYGMFFNMNDWYLP